MWPSNSTTGYKPKKVDIRVSDRYLYVCLFHSSIIPSSQNVGATQCPQKHEALPKDSHDTVLLGLREGKTILPKAETWMNLGHTALSKMSHTHTQILSNCTCVRSPELIGVTRPKLNGGCQGLAGWGVGRPCLVGMKFNLGRRKGSGDGWCA